MKSRYALLLMIICNSSIDTINKKILLTLSSVNSVVNTTYCGKIDKKFGGPGNANVPLNRFAAFVSSVCACTLGGAIPKIATVGGNIIIYKWLTRNIGQPTGISLGDLD